MIYILIFIIGCLLIKMNNLNKMIKVYKNNYFTTLKILSEYDPKLKEYLERWNKNMDKEKKTIIIETADIYLHFPYIMEEEADDLADFLEEEHIEYEGATDIFIDLQNQVKKQKEVIDKAIEYIEKEYYSKNTVDIESMGITTNKLLQVRNLLNEVSKWI